MGERTARNFMQAAEAYGKSTTVVDLPATVLYALAAPSTPEPIREEFMREAEAAGDATAAAALARVEAKEQSVHGAMIGLGWRHLATLQDSTRLGKRGGTVCPMEPQASSHKSVSQFRCLAVVTHSVTLRSQHLSRRMRISI